jgi:hypothetical protein
MPMIKYSKKSLKALAQVGKWGISMYGRYLGKIIHISEVKSELRMFLRVVFSRYMLTMYVVS